LLAVTVRLPHGHHAEWRPVEIGLFADQYLKKGKPLAKVVSRSTDDKTITLAYKAEVPIQSAALHYTTDTGAWQKREWKSIPLSISGDSGVSGTIPTARPIVYFVTTTDERKATVSSEHEVIDR
jgi:hypothetical protein